MKKLLVLAILVLAACAPRESSDAAKLRRDLADTQKKLDAANRTIAAYKEANDAMTKRAASEAARANALEARMERIRALLPQLSSRTTQLASALPEAAPPESTEPAPSGESDWARLERERDERLREHDEWLARTTVYVADGHSYHRSPECNDLYVVQPQRNGPAYVVYIGRPTTLRNARDQRMTPHAECGAPDYNAFQ